MKKLLISTFLVIAAASSAFALSFNEAKLDSKPIVVMFHMHGCGACKEFSPKFGKMASKFSNKFNFVKEDINNSDIAKSLNFKTVPAFFIVEPKTMEAKRIADDCAWDSECFAKTLTTY